MRIVVKVGTHAIAAKSGRPDHAALKRLVAQLCEVRGAGHEVIFVSSGAVAAGIESLGLSARPKAVNDIQMCAAVGQARFIYEYEKLFAEHDVKIGQILLTHYDFENRRRALNVKNALNSTDPTAINLASPLTIADNVCFDTLVQFTAGVDAKDKAPAPAGALLASALMNLGFCGIFRVYSAVSGTPTGDWARTVMLVSALLTLFIATIYMARIGNVKRMLAYSGIEHMSVVTLGLCFGKAGLMAAMLHMVMHTFVKSGLFFHFTQIWRLYSSKMIDDMGDYLKLNPFGALVLVFGFISITAVPPSGLFFSELLVFKAMIAQGSWVVFILTAFMLTVLLWAFARSMFRIIFLPASKPVEKIRIPAWESFTQLALFVLAAYIGFNPPAFLLDLIGQVSAMIQYHHEQQHTTCQQRKLRQGGGHPCPELRLLPRNHP